MIDKRTIFEIHRLKDLGWSERRIAQEIRLGRNTVKKYLENPEQVVSKRSPKPSKLEPFRDLINQFLEQDPLVKAPVVLQRLQSQGFDGKNHHFAGLSSKSTGKDKTQRALYPF